MAPRFGPRLRHLLGLLRDSCQALVGSHPDILEALHNLEEAVNVGFPLDARAFGRPPAKVTTRIRRLQNQVQHLRQIKMTLKQQLEELTVGKQKQDNNRLTPEFLAKVALSVPTTCARGFASAWQDWVGVGVQGCARRTISRIRNSFAEVVKSTCVVDLERAAACALAGRSSTALSVASAAQAPGSSLPSSLASTFRVAAGAAASLPASASSSPVGTHLSAASAPATAAESPAGIRLSAASSPASAASPPVACCVLLHLHDEAALRLRSAADMDFGAPARGRSSKVQQHVATVHFPDQPPLRWFTELDALADKTAQVLAHSLHRVVFDVATTVVKGVGQSSSVVWFIHILVGDGVNTNPAAAARLLQWIRNVPLPSPLRYLLVQAKCSNHQINLALSSVVCGKSAMLSVRSIVKFANLSTAQREAECRRITAPKNVCGTIVRLFKYLVSDYYSHFCGNLHELVRKLALSGSTPDRQANFRRWVDLQKLYGVGVISEGFFNVSMADWTIGLIA